VRHIHSSTSHAAGADWQVLGELELPASSSADPALSDWLAELLEPLGLPLDLLNKVLRSAQDAIVHARQTGAVRKFEHLHLRVFAPVESWPKAGNWGFFGIQKGEGSSQGDHTIGFYLYREG
jgi:hypothetical protein